MKKKLPKDFKPLFWGYRFSVLRPEEDRRIIIVNILNYGNLKQWKWLVKTYGRENLRKAIRDIPESEFRKPVRKLIRLLFKVNKFNYASRGTKIKAEKDI